MGKPAKTKNGFMIEKDEKDIRKEKGKNSKATQQEKLDYIIDLLEKLVGE